MKGYWKAALAAVYVAGLMAFPDAALAAARGAMGNWAASVAPALFPFAAVLPFLTCKEAREIYDRLLGWLLRGVFRLPGSCASALVTGLLGERAIWVCCALLLVSFAMMFVPEK